MDTDRLIACICFLLPLSSCVKPPEYPVKPQVEFLALTPSVINEGTQEMQIIMSFTDGDGDIGRLDGDARNDAFAVNAMTGDTLSFRIPDITYSGNTKAISGEITVRGKDLCRCDWELTHQYGSDYDTVYYYLFIRDRAGHFSNTDSTTAVLINCDSDWEVLRCL